MGIHMDTLEDNTERLDQLSFTVFIQQPAPPKSQPVFECSLCEFRCNSQSALERHVHVAHGGQHIYVRANSQVARELHYFSEPLGTLECINIGHEQVLAEVSTTSSCKNVAVHEKTSLASLLPRRFTGEVQISLFTETRLRARYFLYFVEKPRLNSDPLDKLVFELQLALESGTVPDWRSFESARDEPGRSLFERDYLNGFYEYSLAFHLEKLRQASSGKFEKAMTLLSKFNTSFARTARYILGIRNNSFQALRDCPEDSPFYLCRAFFLDGKLELPKRARRRTENDTGIYVDGFTERILQVVRAFYARDFKNVEDAMAILGRPGVAFDPNNEHKLHLLLARTFRVKGDLEVARRHYDQLSDHPLFRGEVKEFSE